MYFFLDLEGLVIGKADDGWDGFKEGLINIDIGLGIDGVIGQVEELDDAGLLVGLIEEASASQLFLHQLTGRQLHSCTLLLLHLYNLQTMDYFNSNLNAYPAPILIII